jgi:hypothetical protein
MIKEKKSYKKPSKVNRKVKVLDQDETGELVKVNSNSRFPIVSVPEIITNPILMCYRRFLATSLVSGDITIQSLLSQFTFAVTTVLGYTYARMVRLKKIRVLAPVTTQGTSVLVAMTPNTVDAGNNCYNGVSEMYIDTSASIDIPAYLHLSPSLKTPLGSWHVNSNVNTNLLNVQFPSGSTVDMLIEFIPNWQSSSASAYTRVLAAATVGACYAAPILTNLIPQGVNYI